MPEQTQLLPPEWLGVNQAAEQPFVCRWESALSQALSRGPLESSAANGPRLSLGQAAEEEFQVNGFFGVVVGDFLEQLAKRNLDAQFLAKLTHEALLDSFARFAFAAGKLPQTGHVSTGRTLGDKKFLSVKNQPGGNVDGLSGQCSCR